ncbi:MAG: hypothetical protein FJX75_28420 [Armatimonadetes bacterium]|nr:hypothetical protein [Armatimonadota bacterium]
MSVEPPTPKVHTPDAQRTAWIRAAVARVILDTTDPADRDLVREALADLGYNTGAPGAALAWASDSEGVA